MNQILHSTTSLVHVSVALLAVGSGTWLLLTRKGTALHRWIGYAYTVCMVLANLTAFQLYYLFGHFGIVHFGAIVSLVMLSGGIGSALYRPANWLVWHYRLMSASVTGLYAAGLVESTYRLFPAAYFWEACLIVSGLVFAFGGYLIGRYTGFYTVPVKEKLFK